MLAIMNMKPPVKGFTLVELIVVITITAIVSSIIALILNSSLRDYVKASELTNITIEANLAMNRLASELSEAASFSVINTTNISFTKTNNDTVTYQVSGNELQRRENGGTFYPLSNHLSNLSLRYYNNSLSTAGVTANNLQLATISLTLTEGDNQIQLITSVYPRNANP